MIKNIVFDLGGVLISWKPMDYISNSAIKHKEEIYNCIIKDGLWHLVDRGDVYTYKEAIEIWKKRYPELCDDIDIFFFDGYREALFKELTHNVEVVKKCKDAGYNIYVLSNFAHDGFEYIDSHFDFLHHFDGRIISYLVNYCKPEKEIFDKLLGEFNLKAEECLFIDDTEVNIEAANALGFNTIHYVGQDSLFNLINNVVNLNK